jgi:hypothetical protein
VARTLGRELYDRGWRQGSIIPAAAHVPHLDSLDPARWETASPRDPTLVLVTQACDLVKSEVKLPYLEAIACFKDVPLSRSVRLNDSRYFVLSRDAALVADRAHVVLLTRESLAAIPSPAEVPLATEIERRRFARWLGARYDRPALPDEIHPALTIPLGEAFARYCKPGQRLEWLNDHLHEVRVAGPLDVIPE